MRTQRKWTIGVLTIVVSSMFLVTAFSGTVAAKTRTPIVDGGYTFPGQGLIAERGDGWVFIALVTENLPSGPLGYRSTWGTIKFDGAKVVGFKNNYPGAVDEQGNGIYTTDAYEDEVFYTIGGETVNFYLNVYPDWDSFWLYLEYKPGNSKTNNGQDTHEAKGHDHATDGIHDDNGRTGNNGLGIAPLAKVTMTITFSRAVGCTKTTYVGPSGTPYADGVPIPLMD
jgi:hypothetical protein